MKKPNGTWRAARREPAVLCSPLSKCCLGCIHGTTTSGARRPVNKVLQTHIFLSLGGQHSVSCYFFKQAVMQIEFQFVSIFQYFGNVTLFNSISNSCQPVTLFYGANVRVEQRKHLAVSCSLRNSDFDLLCSFKARLFSRLLYTCETFEPLRFQQHYKYDALIDLEVSDEDWIVFLINSQHNIFITLESKWKLYQTVR